MSPDCLVSGHTTSRDKKASVSDEDIVLLSGQDNDPAISDPEVYHDGQSS